MLANDDLLPLAVVALVALSCGIVLTRLRQPAVVGYILAGIVLGPSGLELVRNEASISLLAELGILLLLFVVGMELSLRSFRRIWKIAVTTVVLQVTGALVVVWIIGEFLGWPIAAVVLLAFVLSQTSTAVAVKVLDDLHELRTKTGRIAVGIMVAQDLAVVPMILALDLVGPGGFDGGAVARIVLSIALLAGLIWFLSRRRRVNVPVLAVTSGHADLTPLLGLACCFGAATVSGLLGLTPAYGAFLAGLTIGNSNLRVGMHEMVQPIQSVLMMVFFLSIGLLIDLSLIWDNLAIVLFMLALATAGKTAVNIGIFAMLRLPWGQALLIALALAQVGELAFLLGGIGVQRSIISVDEFRLVIAVAALSLLISPLYMGSIRRLHRVAAYRRASIRYVFRIAFGRQADRLTRAATRTVAIARRLARGRRAVPTEPTDTPKQQPQDAGAAVTPNDSAASTGARIDPGSQAREP